MVPRLQQLPGHAGRDVLHRLHGGGVQLDLLPRGHGARDHRAGLAGTGLCPAALLPIHGPDPWWRRDPRHGVRSHRDGHGRGTGQVPP